MKTTTNIKHLALACFLPLLTTISFAAAVKPATPPAGFKNQYATVNGVKIHYVIGGKGEPLLLVHGFRPKLVHVEPLIARTF
jgi:hypothetical protein